jgi:hypothetical protein
LQQQQKLASWQNFNKMQPTAVHVVRSTIISHALVPCCLLLHCLSTAGSVLNSTMAAHRPRGLREKQAVNQALPIDLLPHVLQYVDQQQRLSSCAQVGHAWQKAATAATTELTLTLKPQHDPIAHVRDWLSKHSRQVQSIAMYATYECGHMYNGINVQLHFQQLQQLRSLRLARGGARRVFLQCSDDEAPSSSVSSQQSGSDSEDETHVKAPNPLRWVSSTLTSLHLDASRLPPAAGGWRCLAALTSLQQLHLTQSDYLRSEDDEQLAEVLPQMTSVTQLCLKWKPEDKVQAALGLLPQLKHLALQYETHGVVAWRYMRGLSLPSSLTRLEVQLPLAVSSSSTPDLKSLTALQHLQLKDITELDASLLSGLTQLTHLQLQMKGYYYKDSGMDEMMRTLRQLLHLQHLELDFKGECGSLDTLPDVSWQYTALTSSKHLTSFILKGVQLPNMSGSGLFGTDLPLLQTIQIDATGTTGMKHEHSITAPLPTPFARGADVSSLVRNCSNLRELDIAGAVKVGVDMGKLSALSGLTSLVVGGECVDDVCAKRLSQLSCLKSLIIVSPAGNAAAVPRAVVYRWVGGGGVQDAQGGADGGYSGGYSCNDEYDIEQEYYVGRGADGSGVSDADEGVEGGFTFAGLRSLMQLASLTTFGISGDTCLFEHTLRWGLAAHKEGCVSTFKAQVSTSLLLLMIELAAKTSSFESRCSILDGS